MQRKIPRPRRASPISLEEKRARISQAIEDPKIRVYVKHTKRAIADATGLTKDQVDKALRDSPELLVKIAVKARMEQVALVTGVKNKAAITSLLQLSRKTTIDRKTLRALLDAKKLWKMFPNLQESVKGRLRQGQITGTATRAKDTKQRLEQALLEKPTTITRLVGLAGLSMDAYRRLAAKDQEFAAKTGAVMAKAAAAEKRQRIERLERIFDANGIAVPKQGSRVRLFQSPFFAEYIKILRKRSYRVSEINSKGLLWTIAAKFGAQEKRIIAFLKKRGIQPREQTARQRIALIRKRHRQIILDPKREIEAAAEGGEW